MYAKHYFYSAIQQFPLNVFLFTAFVGIYLSRRLETHLHAIRETLRFFYKLIGLFNDLEKFWKILRCLNSYQRVTLYQS
jgi:hypothetical protein